MGGKERGEEEEGGPRGRERGEEERKGDEKEGEKRRGRGVRKVSVVNSERQLCMFFCAVIFCLPYVYWYMHLCLHTYTH